MENKEKIAEIVEKYKNSRGTLISVLHEVSMTCDEITLELKKYISEGLGVSLTEVSWAADSYNKKHECESKISVCMGAACRANGAKELLEEIQKHISENVCEGEKKYRAEACGCLCACNHAPVIAFEGEIYNSKSIDDIISKITVQ